MRPVDGELLRLLADMPFLDRLDMVAVSGWSRGGVYRAVPRLEDAGLIASVPHGTELVTPTRRFHLTAAGLRRLAHARNASLEDLLRDLPVSARWRRVLLERLDAVAVVYRLASAISNTAYPIRFRWYRAMPMDAAVELSDGRTIGIVRQGRTTDRTGFSKRLWRLTQGPQPGAVLLLAPDEVRLRHARRRLSQTPAEALFALEREAAAASPDDPVWRLRSVNAAVSLRAVIDRMDRRGALPVERPLARGASLPPDIDEHSPGGDAPDYHAARAAQARRETRPRPALRLALARPARPGRTAGGLPPAGLPAHRRPGGLRPGRPLPRLGTPTSPHRPGAGDAGPQGPHRRGRGQEAVERRPPGRRGLAQRLRQAQPTAPARHGAHHSRPRLHCGPGNPGPRPGMGDRPARSAHQSVPLLPALRRQALGATRRLRRPAARESVVWPFFLEWERRAVRPVTMTERLAPYLRYYSSPRPTEDHGARPAVLVVFHEDLAATHFLRVALEEMVRTRTPLPLLVSHRGLLGREGPLGRAWLAPGGGFEPVFPLPQPAAPQPETGDRRP